MIFVLCPFPVRLKPKSLIDFCTQPLLIFFRCRGTSGPFLWRENAPLLWPAPRGMNLRILVAARCKEDISYMIRHFWCWVSSSWVKALDFLLLNFTAIHTGGLWILKRFLPNKILTFCPLFQSGYRTILPNNSNYCPSAPSPQRRLENYHAPPSHPESWTWP